MPGRRLIILLVLLLISLSVLSASRDVSRTRLPGAPTRTAPPTTTDTTPRAKPAPAGPSESGKKARDGSETTRVRLPGRGATRVPLGSRVIITVTSSDPEIVAVDQLGVRAPVGPGTEGTLDFVASSAGRFPVTLAISGRRIGVLEVGD